MDRRLTPAEIRFIAFEEEHPLGSLLREAEWGKIDDRLWARF
jgi:hypothetical protein